MNTMNTMNAALGMNLGIRHPFIVSPNNSDDEEAEASLRHRTDDLISRLAAASGSMCPELVLTLILATFLHYRYSSPPQEQFFPQSICLISSTPSSRQSPVDCFSATFCVLVSHERRLTLIVSVAFLLVAFFFLEISL
ncbi:hypothetical protein L596_005693 [Steinernema carpocapsae]|uniref:Uncharacterized protein n=1 Tax=Steinernema carpocapsae TaxID=34508 RepID=A0A4U8V1F5_STECR|nr:hypothetical protein L596_005693 [Steinernema carpocapsae]